MNYRKTLLAASIIASLCLPGALYAQDTDQSDHHRPDQPVDQEGRHESGYRHGDRYPRQRSGVAAAEAGRRSRTSRSSPPKTSASCRPRTWPIRCSDLPGVSVGTSSAGEGGFDENDRVSLRGTNPSMTQTLVNGHNIGTGDWFVLNQTATVGRSVSYSLLPAEIVSEVVVHKSSEARLVEGGAAGTVNIITRKPLEFAKPITAQASVGGVYSDLPSSTKPQFSGLFNYRNDASTFGIMAQAFYEERSLQRNGQEILGLNQLQATDAIVAAHPDLNGVYYPEPARSARCSPRSARARGDRSMCSSSPTDNVTVNLNGFVSKLDADNYNRNYLMWGNHFIPGATNLNPGYSVSGNTLTNASFAAVPGDATNYGIYDLVSRKASSSTRLLHRRCRLESHRHAHFKFQAGSTKGEGNSPKQDVLELNTAPGTGASWDFRGTGKPANWALGPRQQLAGRLGAQPPTGSSARAASTSRTRRSGVSSTVSWTSTAARCHRCSSVPATPTTPARTTTPLRRVRTPASTIRPIFRRASSITRATSTAALGGSFPQNIWYYSQADLATYDAQYANRGPERLYPNDIYKVNEKDQRVLSAVQLGPARAGAATWAAATSRPRKTSATPAIPRRSRVRRVRSSVRRSSRPATSSTTTSTTTRSSCPARTSSSTCADDLLLRLAASQTLTRPDYSALAGTVSLDDLGHTGSGGNPHLQPLMSSNFDASLEWYFAPRGLLSAGVYDMSLKDYVNFAVENRSYLDMQASSDAGTDVYANYQVSIPSNTRGHVQGVELNYQQPFGDYVGMALNYTYADGHASNNEPLQGTSKNTANASALLRERPFQCPRELHLPLVVLTPVRTARASSTSAAPAICRRRWDTRSTSGCRSRSTA